jgi:hypothetical protein
MGGKQTWCSQHDADSHALEETAFFFVFFASFVVSPFFFHRLCADQGNKSSLAFGLPM